MQIQETAKPSRSIRASRGSYPIQFSKSQFHQRTQQAQMSKRAIIQKTIKRNKALLALPSKQANQEKKYRKIQEQFKERSNKRYEGKRVMIQDVIEELAAEWCLSVKRIEVILRMKLD